MSDWRRRRRRTSEPKTDSKYEIREVEVPDEHSEPVTLHHLHRYFEGCTVKDRLSPIKANEETRIGTTLNWLLCGNGTLLRGESGSAKTKIMEAVVHLAYGDDGINAQHPQLLVIGHGSNLELFTQAGEESTGEAHRCYVPEFQNIENMVWIIKLWLEGRIAEHRRAEAGGQKHRKYSLQPLPILTSLADGNETMPDIENEMKRRLLSFYTRSDERVNVSVHRMKAQHRVLPDEELVTLSSENFESLRANLLSGMLDTRRVVIPGGTATIGKVVPTKYAISNTFIDYWFDMIEGVARFYRRDRPSTPRYVVAVPGDIYVAHLLVSDTIRDLALGIPPLGREIMERIPESEVWGALEADGRDSKKDRMHIDELVDYLDGQGFPRSKVVVQNAMDRLVGAGFVKQDDRKLYYRTKPIGSGDFQVDWKVVIDEGIADVRKHYPSLLKEYENDAYKFLHPFTGNSVDIPVSPVAEKRGSIEKGGLKNVL